MVRIIIVLVGTTTMTTLLLAGCSTTSTLLLFSSSEVVSSFPVTSSSSSSRVHHHYHRHHQAATFSRSIILAAKICHPSSALAATVAAQQRQAQQEEFSSSSSSISSSSSSSSAVFDDDDGQSNTYWKDKVLTKMSSLRNEALDYAARYDLSSMYEATVYALFQALRLENVPLGLQGQPILWRRDEIEKAMRKRSISMSPLAVDTTIAEEETDTTLSSSPWSGAGGHFFTMRDLEQAVTDDFLDAARGSTDNRKGWKVRK
jgi:hypothetical protein